ncbi:DNA recombination protein RmuC [Maribacter sp. 2307ULW6-5]|uniref:DNA recombination protein RmuC n=1 Tax=Maribacter sp. 2307ULW6-5 TaxID=3386275 RepID=UPI0039BCBB61
METTYVYLLLLPLGLFLGFLLGNYLQKTKLGAQKALAEELENHWQQQLQREEKEKNMLLEERRQLQLEKELLGQKIVRLEGINENLDRRNREQREETTKLQQTFTKEFENLAHKILDRNSAKFTEQNHQNMQRLLHPLQEKIQVFEKKVADSQKENIGLHAALKEQLAQLQHQNLKITQEAENLTKALKGDSKMQGNWGELVLERVLEKSGLVKDREYSVQQHVVRGDGSRVLPDVVINLPNGKKMVVDAKVSLTDYERYINAEEAQRPQHLKNHIASLQRHVSQLSAKKYEDLYAMESPDFVLLFVPMEPAFALATQQDPSLYNKAFEQNIVIVTPTTLLATLRTIDSMWTNERQRRNAVEIARQAGALYDKFHGFVTDMDRVGKKLDEAKSEYQGAMNKLTEGKGNLISRAERLKKMGAKTKKSLPEQLTREADAEE